MGEVSWAAAGTAVGVVIAAAGAWVIKIMTAKSQFRTVDRREVGAEWQQLFNMQQGEILRVNAKFAAQEQEIESLRELHHNCEMEQERQRAQLERATDWIDGAQEGLRNAKIIFRPWTPDLTPVVSRRPASHPDIEAKS